MFLASFEMVGLVARPDVCKSHSRWVYLQSCTSCSAMLMLALNGAPVCLYDSYLLL